MNIIYIDGYLYIIIRGYKMVIISWLNRQLLKMEWLFELIRLLVENVFGLSIDDRLGEVYISLYMM